MRQNGASRTSLLIGHLDLPILWALLIVKKTAEASWNSERWLMPTNGWGWFSSSHGATSLFTWLGVKVSCRERFSIHEPRTHDRFYVIFCVCFGCTTGDKIFIPGGVTGDRSAWMFKWTNEIKENLELVLLWMEEILHQLRLVVYPCVSHSLQGFIHPRWWSPDFFHQQYAHLSRFTVAQQDSLERFCGQAAEVRFFFLNLAVNQNPVACRGLYYPLRLGM